MKKDVFDHYLAVDWSAKNMAIARMTKRSNKITVMDVPSDVKELQLYLKNLKGSKVLTLEETTTSQWLYTELAGYVNKIIICNPHRNRLLSEGPKTDKIDAAKLVQLLKSNLLKEVYHSADKFIYLRRLVSGYQDLVKAGVRLKNQKYSLLKACGRDGNKKELIELELEEDRYVLESIERQIEMYEKEKRSYEQEFIRLERKYPEIKHQKSLPGIGNISAVKIVSRVVAPYRFATKGHYLSYSGLIKLEKISGGRSYGKKNPRYSRELKSVYKTSALSAIAGNNPIADYYRYLIKEKKYPEHNARNKVARRLAILSLGVFKSKKKYQPYRRHFVKSKQYN